MDEQDNEIEMVMLMMKMQLERKVDLQQKMFLKLKRNY